MSTKILKKNITPTAEQMSVYVAKKRSGTIRRNTNLRFGKIIFMSDQDLDG